MKRRLYLIFGAFAAICVVSCQKEEAGNEPQEKQESYISAEIVQDDVVKTHLNSDKYVVWDANDQIKVKGSNGLAIYQLVNGVGDTEGLFKRVSGDKLTGSSFVAYSPASAFDGTNLVWPTSQQYVAEGLISGAPMKAEATSLENKFEFKNLGGLVRLTLKSAAGSKNIASIKIETEDNTIILNCPEGGVAVGTAGTDFYIALPTKEYTKFVVEATATDGSACQRIATKNIKVERSKITSLKNTVKWKFLVSVSPTDKVIFSPGNLYATDNCDGTYSFAFEARQTDFRQRYGYADFERAIINGVETKTPEHTSGLFQWVGRKVSSASAKASYGAFSEIGAGDPSMISDGEDVADFGAAYGDGKTWRALTYNEWNFLLNIRKVNGQTGYGNTCVWAEVSGTQGLIVFHDGYTGATSGLTEIPDDCYFLPDGGYARIYFANSNDYGDYGEVTGRSIPNSGRGCYWTNDVPYTATSAPSHGGCIRPDNGSLNLSYGYRDRGYSVRLVSDNWEAAE